MIAQFGLDILTNIILDIEEYINFFDIINNIQKSHNQSLSLAGLN